METYSLTDMGVTRSMNQDYFFTSDEPLGHLPNLFIVADGMGGHKAGEFASRHTVETIVKGVKKCRKRDPEAILQTAITTANQALREYAQDHPDMRGMGTTVVAAVLKGDRLIVANVGDSRLYLVGNKMRQVTEDHSLVQELVRMGEITKEQARNHPDKNIITRAIGAEKDVDIDFFHVKVREGDKILLCSDGLTNMVKNSEIKGILNREDLSLAEKVELLVDTANKNGGMDNITVVVVDPIIDEV
ncbi:MAG: Stp1/IreP family PP2C-type Ser/Thr phosphatase [Eubacterium sp.]|nr:Stp1/IreP family PP2C-type Ser/Thr phosphatase [Eubacterium sp.]